MNDIIAFVFGMLAGVGALALVVWYYIIKIIRSIKLEEQHNAVAIRQNEQMKQVIRTLLQRKPHNKRRNALKTKDNGK
jgi:cell division protein YceG involved in septum cleavage